MSFYARSGANFSATSSVLRARLYSGTGTDQNLLTSYTGLQITIDASATLTSTWQRFTFTGTVSSAATELTVGMYYAPTGTAGANDFFEVTGVQVDVGNVALPYRAAGVSYQEELAMCQRYFIAYNANQAFSSFGYGFAPTTYSAVIGIPLLQNMRTVPTFTPSAAANFSLSDGVTATPCTSLALESNVSRLGFAGINAGVTSGLTQFRPYRLENNNTISSSLFFSAEL
jgi:hypothetical protein